MNKQSVRHFDEARESILAMLRDLIEEPYIERAVFMPDIFARIRVIMWFSKDTPTGIPSVIETKLQDAVGSFFGGLWTAPGQSPTDNKMLEATWEESTELSAGLRLNERHRSLSVWLHLPPQPPWETDFNAPDYGTPIVSFYAFKGGVGRTTALASFAVQRAQMGERVVVVDLDLSAPGIGTLLSPGMTTEWGVVDYWLEKTLLKEALDFRDYYHRLSNPKIVGAGEILVVPAGTLNDSYLLKLARLNFSPTSDSRHPLEDLLMDIREELEPHWILLDSRAGLSEAAGFALGGVAHLNLLFGTTSAQSWRGIRLAVQRLGKERIQRHLHQDDCLLIHSMVPENPQTAELAKTEFLRRAQETFEELYYLPNPENSDSDEDNFWYIRDMESRDAPHVPIFLYYNQRIAFFTDLSAITEYFLDSEDYGLLGNRIAARFVEA